MSKYKLTDGIKMNKQHPTTVHIPSSEWINNLEISF